MKLGIPRTEAVEEGILPGQIAPSTNSRPSKVLLGSFRIDRNDQPDPIGDAVHVRVDANSGDVESVGENAVSGLPANHRKGDESLERMGHSIVHFLMDLSRDLLNGLCFLIRESSWSDELPDPFQRRIGNLKWRVIFIKKVLGGIGGVLIPGPLRKYSGNQDMEGIIRPAYFPSLL